MGNQLITGVSQHDTRKQRPDNYPAEIPLKIGGRVVRSPDAMTTEMDFVPQLDDFVDRREAENNRRREERCEFGWQTITIPVQHIAYKPNDDRTNKNLHQHVRELVILHWSKLSSVHAKEVSECVDLKREKDKS